MTMTPLAAPGLCRIRSCPATLVQHPSFMSSSVLQGTICSVASARDRGRSRPAALRFTSQTILMSRHAIDPSTKGEAPDCRTGDAGARRCHVRACDAAVSRFQHIAAPSLSVSRGSTNTWTAGAGRPECSSKIAPGWRAGNYCASACKKGSPILNPKLPGNLSSSETTMFLFVGTCEW